MNTIQWRQNDLSVTPDGLGPKTFGEPVDEPSAHTMLDRSLERGVLHLQKEKRAATRVASPRVGAGS